MQLKLTLDICNYDKPSETGRNSVQRDSLSLVIQSVFELIVSTPAFGITVSSLLLLNCCFAFLVDSTTYYFAFLLFLWSVFYFFFNADCERCHQKIVKNIPQFLSFHHSDRRELHLRRHDGYQAETSTNQ